MKIALASKEFINNDIKHNYNIMIKSMVEAKEKGAELILFGEAFLQGFDSLKWDFSIDKDIALTQEDDIIKRICIASEDYSIDIFFGYIELCGNSIYSSYALAEKGKITHNYRRISKGWKEYAITDYHYQEGSSPVLFKYKDKTCLIALCGDLWDFPESFMSEADLLFWPLYVDFSQKEWEDTYTEEYRLRAGSIADNVFLINSVCKPTAVGGCFYFKQGQIVSALAPGNTGLLIIDMERIDVLQ